MGVDAWCKCPQGCHCSVAVSVKSSRQSARKWIHATGSAHLLLDGSAYVGDVRQHLLQMCLLESHLHRGGSEQTLMTDDCKSALKEGHGNIAQI